MSTDRRPLNALLGRGATYQGELSFEGRVRVDGHFKGRIYSDELLEIGEYGLIDGELDVQELVVAGTIRGVVRARGEMTIKSTGRVEGEIRAAHLVTEAGAVIEGKVESGVPAEPENDK